MRRFLILLLTGLLSMSGLAGAGLAEGAEAPAGSFLIGQSTYVVDGETRPMDVAPFIDANGRTMVPVRYLAYTLGISDDGIRWDPQSQKVNLARDGVTVSLRVGENGLTRNGNLAGYMDTSPVIKDDRVFLPARYLAEAFGHAVIWDGAARRVLVGALGSGQGLSLRAIHPFSSPTEAAETVMLYPGAAGYKLPEDLRSTFDSNKISLFESYLIPAGSATIQAWYRENVPGWVLQNETKPAVPDGPDTGRGVQLFRKDSQGILLVTQSTSSQDQTLLVIACGPWSNIESCGRQVAGSLGVNSAGETPQEPSLAPPHGEIPEEPDLPKATPLTWVPNAIVQPVPPGASRVRLQLPVPIDKIVFGDLAHGSGFTPFGHHGGGHPEGFDHVGIPVEPGTPIGSWADGEVTLVKPAVDPGEFVIVISYGDGLWGRHGEVRTPLVKVGDKVKAGEPVGFGMTYVAGTESGEFFLMDNHRTDGVQENGVHVSPFDYLREDVLEQFTSAYKAKVLDPYISKGLSFSALTPWEPYLTNPLLIHEQHQGTLVGEWYLKAPWEIGGYPDVMVLKDADTPYYKENRVSALDSTHGEQVEGLSSLMGSWEADYQKHQIRIETDRTTFYGLFELDETGPRATLKIEYREGSYPTGFSDQAATYVERRPLMRVQDAAEMGVLPFRQTYPNPR